jgi:ATP-dependent exoDNAse (exonuclease V) alpha subunit
MTSHVSVRLFWHDSGWNGAICRDPARNVWCEAHEHVRNHKDVDAEVAKAGVQVNTAGVHPGCEMSIQAFSSERNTIRLWPPDWMEAQEVRPVDLEIGKYSAGMWPYEGMWDESGGFKDNDERRSIATAFFDEVRRGESLAFFYVDERNPMFIDTGDRSPSRVLAGISRIVEIGDIEEWAENDWRGETNMIWSVPFRHDFPRDGIRYPLQAILSAIDDPNERAEFLVALDGGLRTDFRYGSARISQDRAVAVVERAVGALGRLEASCRLGHSLAAELEWLNKVLLELWKERGPYPGLGSLLMSLGCGRATQIQREAVPALAANGKDAAKEVFAALEGDTVDELATWANDVADAADEWGYLETADQELARLLVRMELSPSQIGIVLDAAQRVRHELPGSAQDVLANPYLLSERFTPDRDDEPISFLTVDHALIPHESMGDSPVRVAPRDPRRVRALVMDVLRDRAEDGDTFVAAADALAAAKQLSPEDRACDLPIARLTHPKVAPILDQTVEKFEVDDVDYLALRDIRAHELRIEDVLDDLGHREAVHSPPVDWQQVADLVAEADGSAPVELSDEQRAALDRLLRSAVSVLTGAAGTGKSTLLAPLIAAVHDQEGRVPIRALAPTGKAADRLRAVGVDGMTIHRALAGAGWYDWQLGIWLDDADGRISADTLIIDECSMVDVKLLGTLFKAVDWHAVRRLILVGDHYQLPPIGPGRPFFDLITHLEAADVGTDEANPYRGRLNELTHNYRVADGSRAIALANGFARQGEADEPLIWASLAKGEDQGDLRVRFWQDAQELHDLLGAEIEHLVELECSRAGIEGPDWKRFNTVLGHGDDEFEVSHWQILGPVRDSAAGTRKLNAIIQDRWHGALKRTTRWPSGAIKRARVAFGDEQITSMDKVMQIRNESQLNTYHRRTRENGKSPAYNGQLGIVTGEYPAALYKARRGQKGPVKRLQVEFEGEPDLRFEYFKDGRRGVDQNLELAYAITIHKAQGSQFRHVFLVVPQAAAAFFGRELAYTGLSRAQTSLTLFLEKDIGSLLPLRKRAAAVTPQRASRLLTARTGRESYRAADRRHVSTRGDRVRSKSEVIIADLLHKYEATGRLTYSYEEELVSPGGDPWDLRLPDFTVHVGGKTFYWEHCGMADDPAYRKRWEEVRRPWYVRNGYGDQLIETYEEPDSFDAEMIERDVILGQLLA